MSDYSENIDKAVAIREGENLDENKLKDYLSPIVPNFNGELTIEQFPGGYSNLTFLLKTSKKEYVLRKPPVGANIKSAHDMSREFNVLTALKPVYNPIPNPISYCDDLLVLGAPFYIMERVRGIILRNKAPKGIELTPGIMKSISESAVDNLAALHSINIETTGLIAMGKPEGYTKRQVEGWIKRYDVAQTDVIENMNKTAYWLQANIPDEGIPAFIHNDYKYDNLVLDPENLNRIIAVLDWEMATVGNPLMDLGTTLAYWAEANDSDALKPFNLTWLPGNLTRDEVAQRYADTKKITAPDMLFYYIFGSFKIAVIVQQIYARYKKGFTTDARFANLLYVVNACASNAQKAIQYNRISHFY
ncbi:phosphotransferase family protein [uncultured Flavobacterium sp.]|jgi:aminoglycoside phosphotransferase (APT) family kinase protein|uniref:phosphotransferase family protein n=1 Tax=uncultured Flavobacterium sp. TaxID=165435 RepID=UPI0030CA1369